MIIEKLDIQDGDILVISGERPSYEAASALMEKIRTLGKKDVVLFVGDLRKLTDEDLATAGLERKKQ